MTMISHWKPDFKFILVLSIFVSWTLAQLIIPIKFLPYSIASQLEIFKTIIPVIGIMFCSLLYANKLKFSALGVPFFLFGAFVLIKALIGFLILPKDLDYFFSPIMYLCWVVVMFITAPSIFNSLPKIRALLRCTLATFSIVAIISISFIVFFGIEVSALYKEGRFTYIYNNALYLGAISFSVICSCLMLMELSTSKFERKLLLLFILIFSGVLIASFSRTFILAFLVLLFFYGINKPEKNKNFFIFFTISFAFTFLLILLVLIINNQLISSDTLNELSSNRISLWFGAFQKEFNGFEIIWGGDGSSNSITERVLSDGDSLDATFSRYAIDNTYIEILVNTGLIGMSLFLWGLVNTYLTTRFTRLRLSSIDGGKELVGILSVSHAVFISIIVSALFYGHYPSLGNTINSVALPAALSIIFFVSQNIFSKENQSK